jgi:DNA-binding transcriptional ArsR family regulator
MVMRFYPRAGPTRHRRPQRRARDQGTLPLSDGAQVTRQAITKHLEVLAGAGLVRGARVGRDRIFEIELARLAEARRWLDHIAGQWDEALARLKAQVER